MELEQILEAIDDGDDLDNETLTEMIHGLASELIRLRGRIDPQYQEVDNDVLDSFEY